MLIEFVRSFPANKGKLVSRFQMLFELNQICMRWEVGLKLPHLMSGKLACCSQQDIFQLDKIQIRGFIWELK